MAQLTQRHQLLGEYEYDGTVYYKNFPKERLDRIKNNFELRDNDVLIATYPKSGTTWILEIVWLLMNNGNMSEAKQIDQDTRVPFLEFYEQEGPQNIDILEKTASPRIMKTHLAFKFFEKKLKSKKTKVILGARNVKDVLVSYYHFYRMNIGYGNMTGPFDDFFELFKDKHLAFGDWFDFNLDYWNNRHFFNFFLLKYEDLQKDPKGTIQKISEFLEKSISEAELDTIVKHVAFDAMKSNDAVNMCQVPDFDQTISPFLRKGIVGDWKNYFTDEQNEYVYNHYKERIVGTGLEFDFELAEI